MTDFEQAQNELERCIAALPPDRDAADYDARRKVIVALATEEVTVVLAEPWDGESAPETGPRPMLVSDGPDTEQPMLAVFSRAERAREFEREHGGGGHPSAVPGPWAILAARAGAGIIINPNQALGFRVAPSVVAKLGEELGPLIERLNQRGRQA